MENNTINPLSPEVKKILDKLKQGKEDFVNYYGKDAEQVMVDRAIKLSKKINEMKNFTPEEKLIEKFVKSLAKKLEYSEQDAVNFINQTIKKMGLKSSLSEDIDIGHEDDEPNMIKGDLYQIRKDVDELYSMVEKYDNINTEIDFPAWWQEKISQSKAMLSSAKEYLDFESNDIMEAQSEDTLSARLYKIKNHVQPAFYKRVRMMINNGDLEKAEEFISRIEPIAAKKDTEFAAMKGELDSLGEGLPKGYFKKEFNIGKKKVKEAAYPWDKCVADRKKEGKSEEDANKICGAIKAAYSEGIEEKKLTKAEKKKKEEIVKGMKGSFKGNEGAMYAIATAKAKKIAEAVIKKLKEVNLKQNKLSSEEYQKAKKQKDFKASDWKWNSKENLYTKVNEVELSEETINKITWDSLNTKEKIKLLRQHFPKLSLKFADWKWDDLTPMIKDKLLSVNIK